MQILHRLRRLAATLLPIALCAGMQPVGAAERTAGANLVNLFNFGSPPADFTDVPKSVKGDMLLANDGNIYFASAGGGKGFGAIGRIAPDGTVSVVYAFASASEALSPFAGLVQASDNNLYGTTFLGGEDSAGVVFRLTLAGEFTQLHQFKADKGGHEPRLPYAGLVEGPDGALYGTTLYGGPTRKGTVFRITTDGTFSIIHNFAGSDGENPEGRLVVDSDGAMYGTTMLGGASNRGVVYRITTSGGFTRLYSFPKLGNFNAIGVGTNAVGANPRAGLLRTAAGEFYGTAYQGGASGYGSLYRVSVSGDVADVTAVHSFAGAPFGSGFPLAAPVLGPDGSFYGTTEHGGYDDDGTVWKVAPGGAFTLLHSFSLRSGAFSALWGGHGPNAGVLFANNKLYGVSYSDATEGSGMLFRLDEGTGGVPPIDLTISKTQATEDETVTVTWNAPDAASCDKFGSWDEPVAESDPRHVTPVSGSEDVKPFAAAIYTYGLACIDAANVTRYAYVALQVDPPAQESVDGGEIIGGGALSPLLLALLALLLIVKLTKETRSSCP
jgi:uncharacterized repeat protein (TIGR03803 family)